MNMFEIASNQLKKRVLRAIDNIDDDEVLKNILQQMKGSIFQGNLKKALTDSGIKERFSSGHQKAYDWFAKELEHIKVPLEDKIHLLALLKDETNLIPSTVFTTSGSRGKLFDNLSPRIKNNSAFKLLKDPLMNFGIAGPTGMGPGEAALIILTQGAKESEGKKGGDFAIGDWKVEVKMGGAVPPGDSGQKVGDQEIKKLLDIAEKNGISYEDIGYKKGFLSPSFERGWLPKFFQQYAGIKGDTDSRTLLGKYLKVIYPPIEQDLVDAVYDGLGQTGNNRTLAPLIYNMYKKSHGWNSMCFIDKLDYEFVNTIEADDIPDSAGISYKLRQGGDTYAVASGAFMLHLKPDASIEGDDVPNLELNPKPQRASKIKPEPGVDPAALQQRAEQVKQEIDIEQTRKDILADAGNPITQAYKARLEEFPQTSPERADALQDLLDLIANGLTQGLDHMSIAQQLQTVDLYERQLNRIKQLIR